MPYYNENTVYYRRLTASYGDVQLLPPETTSDVVSATPCQKHSRKTKIVAVERLLFLVLPHSIDLKNSSSRKKVYRDVRRLEMLEQKVRFKTNSLSELGKLMIVGAFRSIAHDFPQRKSYKTHCTNRSASSIFIYYERRAKI